MDHLGLRGSVVPWPFEIPSHADCRSVSGLLVPLADGALAGATLGDCVFVTFTTVTLAT